MGNEFKWFTGVVEDANNDPLKLGRCRVRIFGIHSEKLVEDDQNGEGIPTDKLPWATIMAPVTSSSINGIGESPTGIVNGTHVVGFARDGLLYQDLIIMGTLNGIPQSTPIADVGFNDPDLQYPKEDFIGEPDVNRLARNESIDQTIVQTKRDGIEQNVSKALWTGSDLKEAPEREESQPPDDQLEVYDEDDKWSEPRTLYDTQYPFNQVVESRSGHITEIDDTPEKERLHTYHKTGTFEEIYPDGSKVQKIVGSDYEIILQNRNLIVKGNVSVTIEGNQQLLINGNETVKIDGNSEFEIVGDRDELLGGNKTNHIRGNDSTKIDLDRDSQIMQNESLRVEQDKTAHVEGNYDKRINGNSVSHIQGNETRQVNGNVSESVQGNHTLDVEGHTEIQSPTINVGIDGMEPAVLGEKLEQLLQHLIQVFNSHTHIGNMGTPTSTPPVLGHTQQYSDPKSTTVNVQA